MPVVGIAGGDAVAGGSTCGLVLLDLCFWSFVGRRWKTSTRRALKALEGLADA